ncbi:MAG: selenium metabolism-associated LysR family transcriptional regulator [Oscillospiraceae bacterium]
MQVKQLEAFVNVVKFKSFSKAAENIYLSQPSISAYINSLENELNTKLLIRSTKEVYPSKAGERLYSYAVEILKTLDRAETEIRSITSDVKGTLEIAASTVPAQYLLPDIFASMLKEYNDITFEVKQYNSSETVKRIVSMDVEIGVVGMTENKSKCDFEPFVSDKLVLITPVTDKYLSMGEDFPIESLMNESFVMRFHGSGTLKQSERYFEKMGFNHKNQKVTCMVNSTESAKQMVAKGLGVSVISSFAAADYEKLGLVKVFDLHDNILTRDFFFAYHKDRPLSPAAIAFIDHANHIYGKQQV